VNTPGNFNASLDNAHLLLGGTSETIHDRATVQILSLAITHLSYRRLYAPLGRGVKMLQALSTKGGEGEGEGGEGSSSAL
jgi:hypothetical protein